MQTIPISLSHLSSLNQVIRTQHRLLKLKLPLSNDPSTQQSLTKLFSDFTHINIKLHSLYQALQLGTICFQDKHAHQHKLLTLSQQLQTIQSRVHQMQFEKQSLESNCLKMRSQLEEQTVQASLFRAELNKMAQEKTALGNRLAERTEQLKEAKGQVELWKAKVEKIKERYAELQGKYRALERVREQKEKEVEDELERELRELREMEEQEAQEH